MSKKRPKTTKTKKQLDGVIWLDRGWQPVHVGFVPSKEDWEHHIKSNPRIFQHFKDNDYVSTNAACMTYPETADSNFFILIFINEKCDGQHSLAATVGLIAHECMHAYQYIIKHIGEEHPSREFEAYAVQALTQETFYHFMRTRGHKIKWKDD